ncbi:MAG: glycosyltransferase family 4 protein, partial [Mycobacteriales bacterium]
HVHSALAPGVTLVRAGLLAAAARSRGCRVVVHAHGGRVQLWLTTPARRRVARLALAAAGRVVAVSEGGRDALLPVLGSDRVVLVDNGIDVDAFGPPGPVHSPPRVLFVGLLTPRKGVLDLVEASRLLRARGVAHELRLVGGSPDEGPDAERQVRDALPPDVRLLGALPPDQMPAAYRDADVLCLPSWWEAMPLSVLEAMATGLPVVATAVGDVPRIVEDGVTGRVVPAQDPVALADALQDVLASPGRAARMGAAGRERAQQRYSATAMSDALSDVYDAVREVGA